MKKFFAVLAIFALVLVGCGEGNSTGNENEDDGGDSGNSENSNTTLKIKNESSKTLLNVLWNNIAFYDAEGSSEFIGTWTGSYSETSYHEAGVIEVEISSSSWSVLFKDDDGYTAIASGILGSKTGNIQYLVHPNRTDVNDKYYYCGNVTLSANKLILNVTTSAAGSSSFYFPLESRRATYELTKLGDPLKPGTNVTKNVENGSGYIFFKVGATSYRTKDLVLVEKNENKEFTFNDYTIVVDITKPEESKTLGSL